MLERASAAMILGAAIGSGVVGGVLLAFSTFVMAALARLPAPQGIAAMQAINITVINPVFMLTFLGTGVVCLGLIALQLAGHGAPSGALLTAAAATYLIGCLGVTMAFNVPLNDALAGLQSTMPDAGAFWPHYLATWTNWNHVRTVAAIAAAAALTFVLRNTPPANALF